MYESGYNEGFGALGAMFWLFAFAAYLFFAYCQYRIAKKCNLDDVAWWGFVPILNTFLLIKCANRPGHWFLFLLIPLANLVAFIILWVDTAQNVGKSPVWGVLTLVPFINFVSIGVLAFGSEPSRPLPPQTPAPRQPAGVS